MKKLSCLLPSTLVSVLVFAQATPVTPVETMNAFTGATSIFAPFELHSPYSGVGPVMIHNAAQVDFRAGERIELKPGFQAVNFTGSGYFHAQIDSAPDFDIVFIEPNESYPQVGLNEKLEIGMTLPATLATQVQTFLSTGNGVNPFDPDMINIEAEFSNGTESFKAFAFYYEDFVRDPNAMGAMQLYNWIPQPTEYNWRIRFAPTKLGVWIGKISVYINGSATSLFKVDKLQFECVPSNNPGFLQVGSDQRHLKFSSSGNSFFAIGQNIAWPDQPWFRGQQISTTPLMHPGGVLDIYDWINSLADNRGNFVRFIVTPEMGEIEWGQLGNYNAVTSTDTLDPHPATGLMQAWEIDQLFELCESRDVYLMFNLVFQGEYNADTPGSRGWAYNPYNLEISGITYPFDLFRNTPTNDEVLRRLHNKHRYYLARYGYSTSLGVLQLFSEFENWTYNEPLEYDPFFRDDAYDFLRRISSDIKANDAGSKHLLTVSFGHEPWNFGSTNNHIFSSTDVDLTNFNRYPNERTSARELYKAYNYCTNCGPINQSLFSNWNNKPALITETGLFDIEDSVIIINGNPHTVPVADPGDISSCSDITFHNYMWSSSFSGGYGTALNWWQWFNNDHREQNFPAMGDFFSTVDFESQSYENPGRWDDGVFTNSTTSLLETVFLKSESNDHCIGWAHNMSYWWGNVDEDCPDRYGFLMPITTNDLDDIWSDPQTPGLFDRPKVEGMNFGRYHIQKYSTRNSGGPIGSIVTNWVDVFGRLPLPELEPGEADYAFKADRDPLFNFRTSGDIVLDTLFTCAFDSVQGLGHFEDTLATSYTWWINDIFYSNEENPYFSLTQDGAFEISLVASDSTEILWTLSQIVIVQSCTDSSSARFGAIPDDSTGLRHILVYPNPTTDLIIVEAQDYNNLLSIRVFNSNGSEVSCAQRKISRRTEIDLTELPSGIYMILVETDYCVTIKRVAKLN